MKNRGVSNLLFLAIFVISALSNIISCSNRDEEINIDNNDSGYSVEIKYVGDIQNWEEKLSVSMLVESKKIPLLTGVNVDSSQKISDTEYLFILPKNLPADKMFKTSPGVTGISLNGNITMKNSNAQQLAATVKVYKNNELKFESEFTFNSTHTYPYYNINVN